MSWLRQNLKIFVVAVYEKGDHEVHKGLVAFLVFIFGMFVVNEKTYQLSFCEDPFLCDNSNDSVDTCRYKIRMLFQPNYVRFPLDLKGTKSSTLEL